MSVFEALIEIETKASRVEGILAADPELARLWRAQAAVTEACRSVSMEDISVLEGDFILRSFENASSTAETARGISAANDILSVLTSPGDFQEDPRRHLERAMRASVSLHPDPMDEGQGMPSLSDEDVTSITSAFETGPSVFLSCLRATARFRSCTGGWSPSTERLLFVILESSRRRIGAQKSAPVDPGEFGADIVLSDIHAYWTALPATALTTDRFLAWSVSSRSGMDNLMTSLSRSYDHVLGSVPVLRGWKMKSYSYAHERHKRSRIIDLVRLVSREPILTTAKVKDRLGVAERTALNLLSEAQDIGMLSLITPRKSYRAWALPFLADRLRLRHKPSAPVDVRHFKPADRPDKNDHHKGDVDRYQDRQRSKDEREAREAELFAELDEAMARADAILAKYRS